MYRPYWIFYQSLGSANRNPLHLSHKGQLVFAGVLLAVYAVTVVVALWAIS